MRNRNRNDARGLHEISQPNLSIFKFSGREAGSSESRYLNDGEFIATHLHVLLNYKEVQPYIGYVSKFHR